MQHWIFIASTKIFRMEDWMANHDYVEYVQKNKVSVGDIVYIYITEPVQRIKYKMYVERINIPLAESADDSAFSLNQEEVRSRSMDTKMIRLRLIRRTETPTLHFQCLKAHGLKSSLQKNEKAKGELLEYIENQFPVTSDMD